MTILGIVKAVFKDEPLPKEKSQSRNIDQAENFLRQEASVDPKEISDKICLEENAEQLGESAMQKTPADKKENKSEHQVKFSRSGKRDAFNDQ